jgi:hypothetical protein
MKKSMMYIECSKRGGNTGLHLEIDIQLIFCNILLYVYMFKWDATNTTSKASDEVMVRL